MKSCPSWAAHSVLHAGGRGGVEGGEGRGGGRTTRTNTNQHSGEGQASGGAAAVRHADAWQCSAAQRGATHQGCPGLAAFLQHG